MAQESETHSPQENALFWLERTITAMRAARERSTRGRPPEVGPVYQRGEMAADISGPTGVAMPLACWERFGKQLVKIGTCCGLSVKMYRRYTDPVEVVFLKFSRKETP